MYPFVLDTSCIAIARYRLLTKEANLYVQKGFLGSHSNASRFTCPYRRRISLTPAAPFCCKDSGVLYHNNHRPFLLSPRKSDNERLYLSKYPTLSWPSDEGIWKRYSSGSLFSTTG